MPIIDKNGKTIKENDFIALMEMLRGSLDSHIRQLNSWKNSANRRDEDPEFFERIITCYRNGRDQLENKLRTVKGGRNRVRTENVIDSVFSEISENVIRVLGEEDKTSPAIRESINSLFSYVVPGWADKGLSAAYPDRVDLSIQEKDTAQAYDRTEDTFSFVYEPFPGIEDIKEYNPTKDDVSILYNGRIEPYQRKLEEARQQLEGVNENEPAYLHLRKELTAAENDVIGLRAGGELTRGFSAELRNMKDISFGEMYNMLKRLNEAVQPGEETAGKLRGRDIINHELKSMGSHTAPQALYKTLSKVADGINQVKKVEDPGLRKSRAIQLAAFSYQMLMSEKVFNDANGRTCRLFADTILQTFGLPPHTPAPEDKNVVKTMGEPMDFNAGAAAIYQGVIRSEKTLREEREKDIETEDEKQKKRHNLLNEIKAGIANEGADIRESEEYRNYIREMKILDTRMAELCGIHYDDEEDINPEDNKEPVDNNVERNLTPEDKEDLMGKMVRAAEAGERFLDSSKAAGKNVKTGIYAVVKKLQNLISRDYDTVRRYDPESPNSLNAILEDSRTLTVDFRNRKIKTLGLMQSSRVPMTVYGADGRKRTGVFTKASYVRVKSKFDAILREAERGCNADAVNALRSITRCVNSKLVLNSELKDDGNPVRLDESPEYAIGKLVSHVFEVRNRIHSSKLSDSMIKRILRYYDVQTQRIPDRAIKVLANGLNNMSKHPANWFNTTLLFLKDGARLDQRNSAMSVVAGLMGADSLLARSNSMRYIDEQGKVVEGTFMDFGKGIDLGNDPSLAKHINESPMRTAESQNAMLKSLAELKIIDFLCLNVDRHHGNIMYQVDAEGNLTGIQGIDNDSSFGPRRWNQTDVNGIKVISRSMADRVEKLTPEMMRFALRGRGLTEEEINAAAKRLKVLKRRINNNMVRIIEDDQFKTLTETELYDPQNTDDSTRDILQFIRSTSLDRQHDGIRFVPYVDQTPEKSKVSTTERKYTIGGLVDLSEKVGKMIYDEETGFNVEDLDSYGRRSEEFNEVMRSVILVKQVPDYLRDNNLLKEDLFISEPAAHDAKLCFDNQFTQLNQALNRYLAKKRNQRGTDEKGKIKGKNDYEQKRIDYAMKLKAMVREYEARKRGPVGKAEEQEKQALIRRREQNKRNKAPGL